MSSSRGNGRLVSVLWNDQWYLATIMSINNDLKPNVMSQDGTKEWAVDEARIRPRQPEPESAALPSKELVAQPAPKDAEVVENKERCGVCSDPYELVFAGGDDDKLMICESCEQVVHRTCWGGSDFQIPEGKWYCATCQPPQPRSVSCLLCRMYGGLLKPTVCGQWCHVSCMLAFRNPSQAAIGYQLGVRVKINVFEKQGSDAWREFEASHVGRCEHCGGCSGLVVKCSQNW
eukprot:TRINITY_DN24277_c0_g1_i1.p1 TRINITY_DN24277_c0_g1~~TRINITY_DN24277_c0_g1_i1.p1  ORF type:complete len:232 (+),score=48.17 TRINITY_DN24277_c0_g1_i1:46-741(+)